MVLLEFQCASTVCLLVMVLLGSTEDDILLCEVRSQSVLTSPQFIAICGQVLGLYVIAYLLTLDSSTQMIVIVQFTKNTGSSLPYVAGLQVQNRFVSYLFS